MKYEEYLRTRHWRVIKQRMYDIYRCCYYCGTTKNLDVHHAKGYENIGREKLTELKLLCRTCHYRTHRMNKGIRYWRPNDMMEAFWSWLKKTYSLDKRRGKWQYS